MSYFLRWTSICITVTKSSALSASAATQCKYIEKMRSIHFITPQIKLDKFLTQICSRQVKITVPNYCNPSLNIKHSLQVCVVQCLGATGLWWALAKWFGSEAVRQLLVEPERPVVIDDAQQVPHAPRTPFLQHQPAGLLSSRLLLGPLLSPFSPQPPEDGKMMTDVQYDTKT